MPNIKAHIPVYEFDKDKQFVQRYDNCQAAAEAVETTYQGVYQAARQQSVHKDRYWSFEEILKEKVRAF